MYTESENKLARWCKVLRATSLEGFKEAIGEDLMTEEENKEIEREIRRISANDECIALYTKLSHEELLRNTAVENGIQQGLRKGKEEIVLNMLDKNYDLEIISELTGLSLKEIEELKK